MPPKKRAKIHKNRAPFSHLQLFTGIIPGEIHLAPSVGLTGEKIFTFQTGGITPGLPIVDEHFLGERTFSKKKVKKHHTCQVKKNWHRFSKYFDRSLSPCNQ